ncbi:MAG: tRNA (adenosine(37)-N6)-threonylcarbamoyltransferase complex ATPase subunit type 1 TsaE [Methylococcales symbiont of Hymedesmia sp. n. MRB-2018]|nr:MAG: tRNA (adenosine(37)-N6)-threonylcarbamoyltransferase complex ATPase subunit type 1 TsaE [Methylococcales symbiont of Hymedesmia sp. n. MRB-2018]KAF3982746.1 MAG: tRNA (adenosine(37)-N6)-threonylcarbamoyltransferase complex ATPase subunit type 1 TsaE [Methylococcales symbiont of Hymedesmia sp. n. MRB-2018]
MKIELFNEQETEQLGAELWKILPEKFLVFLSGDLGAGKTTLTRGFLRAAGHTSAVKSPTYTLVEEYELSTRKLYHFDLYRIKYPEELEWMGMQDYLAEQSLCFIEWPENGKCFLPTADLDISISGEGNRRWVEIKNLSNINLKLHWKNKDILL